MGSNDFMNAVIRGERRPAEPEPEAPDVGVSPLAVYHQFDPSPRPDSLAVGAGDAGAGSRGRRVRPRPSPNDFLRRAIEERRGA